MYFGTARATTTRAFFFLLALRLSTFITIFPSLALSTSRFIRSELMSKTSCTVFQFHVISYNTLAVFYTISKPIYANITFSMQTRTSS